MRVPDPAKGDLARLHNPRVAAGLALTAREIAAGLPVGEGVGVVLVLSVGFLTAASNSFAEAVNAAQSEIGEGPGLTAAASESSVRAVFGTDERRWPTFQRAAETLGLGAMVSVPVQPDQETLGSVSVCSRSRDGIAMLDEAAVLDVTTDVITQLQTAKLLAQLSVQVRDLRHAFDERSEVDIAVGVLIARYRYSASQARIMLDQLARQDGSSLAEAARQIIEPPPA